MNWVADGGGFGFIEKRNAAVIAGFRTSKQVGVLELTWA
jgi:hypothetical protein